MKKILLVMMMVVFSTMLTFAQTETAEEDPAKYISFNTEFKPYVEGGYFIAEDIALTMGLGFYRNGADKETYFMLKGGIDKFIKETGHIRIYAGGAFAYEANPDAVGRGPYDSKVTIDGHFGGWLKLSRHIYLDGKIGVNLDFCNWENPAGESENSVNFGTITSSIGVVIVF